MVPRRNRRPGTELRTPYNATKITYRERCRGNAREKSCYPTPRRPHARGQHSLATSARSAAPNCLHRTGPSMSTSAACDTPGRATCAAMNSRRQSSIPRSRPTLPMETGQTCPLALNSSGAPAKAEGDTDEPGPYSDDLLSRDDNACLYDFWAAFILCSGMSQHLTKRHRKRSSCPT